MVEFINYKNKRLPVRISYYALSKYKEETGEEFNEENLKKASLEMLEPVLFYSLESGHRATGDKMTLEREDMFDVMEECFMEYAKLLPKFFPDEDELVGEKNASAPALGNREQRRKGAKKK